MATPGRQRYVETSPDVSPDAPAHFPGARKGEEESGRGHTQREVMQGGRTARDATSINPDKRGPIDPRMPNMPPA
jgi:hypothetical protein